MPHELEKILNAPANEIMDAILRGFRAQVDVKGKLAELYLYKKLKELESVGDIQEVKWLDADGEPDFTLRYKSNEFRVECKNLRNETYKTPRLAYKVEIQKTRNSKDGTNTRSYRRDYFDILAVCTFNQTKEWEFYFIRAIDLQGVPDNPELPRIMQRVPIHPSGPWRTNILEVLS